MKYSEFISTIEQHVVTEDLWDSDENRLINLRNLIYTSAITIGEGLPLSYYNLSISTEIVDNTANPEEAPFPDDVFRHRPDLGIGSIIIKGNRYMPSQQNKYGTVLQSIANNSFYSVDEVLFNIDLGSRKVFGMNLGDEIDFNYLPIFNEPAPTQQALSNEDFPLSGNHLRSAISLVSVHLQGNDKRDTQGAQFNMILSKLYGGKSNG